jgi:molybdopterin-guanine dinucleotide biosynthesis protein A
LYIDPQTHAILILAGGMSSRMKRDKTLLRLKGIPLIEWVFEAATKISNHIYISVHEHSKAEVFSKLLKGNVTYLVDDYDGPRSVLLGLLSSFRKIREDFVSIVPADSPFVKQEALEHIIRLIDGFDAAIPMWPDGRIEAIHATYRREAILPTLEKAWEQHTLELNELVKHIDRIAFVGTETFTTFDPLLTFLLDADTPTEFERLDVIAEKTDRC